MNHLGDVAAGAVLYGSFTTYRPSTGAVYALAGTPVLQVYKDDSATQWTTVISVANGTLSNPDSIVGFNVWKLDTSADGSFFATGHTFHIVITTGTVDSVDISGSVVATFTLGLGQSTALRPATAGRTLAVDAAGIADANVAKINEVATTSVTTVSAYIGTTAANTAQTGDGFAVVKSGGTGDNAAIKTKTDNLPASPAAVGSNMGTVASVTANVNADIKKVNGTTVTGSGTEISPWGPA